MGTSTCRACHFCLEVFAGIQIHGFGRPGGQLSQRLQNDDTEQNALALIANLQETSYIRQQLDDSLTGDPISARQTISTLSRCTRLHLLFSLQL